MYTDEFDAELFWTCRYCSTLCPAITGAEDKSLRCVHCGANRADEPLTAPAEFVPLTGDASRLAASGPDWCCPSCDGGGKYPRRATETVCNRCGAERPVLHSIPSPPTNPEPAPVFRRDPDPEPISYPDYYEPAQRKSKSSVGIVLLVVVTAVLLSFGAYRATRPNHITVSVVSAHWQIDTEIRIPKTFTQSGWRDEAPANAYNLVCADRQVGTEQCRPYACNPHTEPYDCRCVEEHPEEYNCRIAQVSTDIRENCRPNMGACTTEIVRNNGNGSVRVRRTCPDVCDTRKETHPERRCDTRIVPRRCDTCTRHAVDTCHEECPVNRSYCTSYQYDGTVVAQTAVTRGTDRETPTPATGLVQGARMDRATYVVVFRDDREPSQQWHREMNAAAFRRYHTGQRYRASYTRAGDFTIDQRIR